jgi:hypothetical protein
MDRRHWIVVQSAPVVAIAALPAIYGRLALGLRYRTAIQQP